MPERIRLLLAAFVALVSAPHPGPRASQAMRRIVFAAASLKNALDAAVEDYTGRTGKTVSVSYAGSSTLAKQIAQGAPADIFLSANMDWMDKLAEQGAIDTQSRVTLLGNAIVLVAPKDSDVSLTIAPGFALADALGDGRLAMAETTGVPAGIYGRAALESLGVWDSVAGKVAQADNVRAALALVSRGETPFGIVYATDAKADPGCASSTRSPRIRIRRSSIPQRSPRSRNRRRASSSPSSFSPRRNASTRSRASRSCTPGSSAQAMELTPAELVAIRLSLRVAINRHARQPAFRRRGRHAARPRTLSRAARCSTALVHLPLVLPPVVTGYLLLIGFGRKGPIGAFLNDAFGIVFAFRWTGAALAAGIMGFPLLVRAIRLSIEAVDRRLEDAAASLGARSAIVFATITLPLIFPGLLAGAVLSFARAMGEFGATITFVSNIPGETQTIPSAIYTALQIPGAEAAAIRLSLVSIAISLAALILSELLARRMRKGRTAS